MYTSPALSSISLFLLVLPLHAHFILNYPPSIGFSDEKEIFSPCGGYEPKFSGGDASPTNVTASSFSVEVTSTHPQNEWLLRVTNATGGDSESWSWMNLINVVNETGSGDFCVGDLRVGSDWVGKNAVLQVMQMAAGEVTYQCSTVIFSEGSPGIVGRACVNSTNVTSEITDVTSTATMPLSTASTMMTMTMSMTETAAGTKTDMASMTATETGEPTETAESGAAGMVGVSLAVLFLAFGAVMVRE